MLVTSLAIGTTATTTARGRRDLKWSGAMRAEVTAEQPPSGRSKGSGRERRSQSRVRSGATTESRDCGRLAAHSRLDDGSTNPRHRPDRGVRARACRSLADADRTGRSAHPSTDRAVARSARDLGSRPRAGVTVAGVVAPPAATARGHGGSVGRGAAGPRRSAHLAPFRHRCSASQCSNDSHSHLVRRRMRASASSAVSSASGRVCRYFSVVAMLA